MLTVSAMSSIYGRSAELYDIEHGWYTKRVTSYVFHLFRKLKFKPRTVLDLGCGTGIAAITMARRGLKVYGLDASHEMLYIARKKLRDLSKPVSDRVKFIAGDMRNLHPDFKVDLVTSLSASLNCVYEEGGLERVLKNVSKVLKSGGYFMFDLNTIQSLRSTWGNEVEVKSLSGGHLTVSQSRYDPETHLCRMHIILFKLVGGRRYVRIDENLVQRGYTLADVRRGLRKAGFADLRFYELFRFASPKRKTEDLFCVSRIWQ